MELLLARDYAWDPVTSRVYFFRDDISPNDLHYEVIDQATGQITSVRRVALSRRSYGVGRRSACPQMASTSCWAAAIIYAQNGLTWSGSLGSARSPMHAGSPTARWSTLTTAQPDDAAPPGAHQPGDARAADVHGPGAARGGHRYGMVMLVDQQRHRAVPQLRAQRRQRRRRCAEYGGRIPAGSRRFGRHGSRRLSRCLERRQKPGRQHHGPDAGCIPTGLGLLSAAHGTGGVCNYGATDSELHAGPGRQHGDIIYLLSSANRRVYRWSITAAPISILTSSASTRASALGADEDGVLERHQRLYLGYDTGRDPLHRCGAAARPKWHSPSVDAAVRGTGERRQLPARAGVSGTGQRTTCSAAPASITAQGGVDTSYSRDYAWDPVTSRVYFFRDGYSPNDLHYEVIDQAHGPDHLERRNALPRRVQHRAADPRVGQRPVRAARQRRHLRPERADVGGLAGLAVADARWFANGTLVTLATATTRRRCAA